MNRIELEWIMAQPLVSEMYKNNVKILNAAIYEGTHEAQYNLRVQKFLFSAEKLFQQNVSTKKVDSRSRILFTGEEKIKIKTFLFLSLKNLMV